MRMIRTAVFWLHLAIGCVAGLVILVMSVTGVLLAFERQINAWADAPAVLQTQTQSATDAPLDTILANLKNAGQGVPSELILHRSLNAPLEARFGRERTLYLNPWSGEIVGELAKGTRTFFNLAERVHRSLGLGMQSALGRGATSAANLAFLLMLLSGFYLWLPRVFNFASLKSRILLRRGLVGRTREWNWHHVAGIWAVLPLLFIVVTGVITSYPWASNLLFTMSGSQPPSGNWGGERPAGHSGRNGVDHQAAESEASASQSIPLAGLAQIAEQQEAQWKSITIQVPQAESEMLAVSVYMSIGGQRRARRFGDCWLGCELWRQLGLEQFWQQRLEEKVRRETVDWEKVLRLLVVNRLIDPGSEFRVHRHWFDQSAMGELLGQDFAVAEKNRLYRCLDRILEHKQELFAHLRQRWADLFGAEFDVLLYDLTRPHFAPWRSVVVDGGASIGF